MSSLVTRFALRSLGRNIRRTLLSAIGIGIGCAIAIFMTAFVRGGSEIRIRSIADSGFGHARIVPDGWAKSRDNKLRLQDWEAALEAARNVPGVRLAAPHAGATGLLAFGTRVAGVELTGVDPAIEQQLSRLVRVVQEGRYLMPEDENMTVVGRAIADRLDVELGDDLLLTVTDRNGDMAYAMLQIVGIVTTGSRDIDAGICHVPMRVIEQLTGFQGAADITLMYEEIADIDRLTMQIRDLVPAGDTALTWKEVVPAQGKDAESDQVFMGMFSGIVAIVVILGITSAQLTAILERKREFAVLIALGMKSARIIRLVLMEAVAIGLIGAAVGLLIGTPLVYYVAVVGIDFSTFMGGDMAVSNVLMEPVFYADMGFWIIPQVLAVALVSTVIAAVYPAIYVLKTNPTTALSLREA